MRTLHADDLQGLYSKFPAQPIPPSKPLGRGTAPAEMTTSTAIPFTMKPSVGTWLMAPPKMKSESPNLAAVAPVEIIEEAPMEASVPVIAKPPETSLTPFKDYYASHVRALHPADMQNLYAKFPSQTAPPSKPLGQSPAAAEAPAEAAEAVPFTMQPFKDYYASHIRTLEPTDMQNLYSKFPSQRAPASKPAEPAAAAAIPFTMKPSVGTWLMAPPKMKSESPNLAAVAPVEIIEEAHKEASAPVIAKPPETSLIPFKDYYASHVRALHPTDMQNLYAKFPSQRAPASKPAEPAAAAAIPFTMKPSVGTWLMAPPKMKSESPNLAAVAPVEIIEEAPKEASAPVIAKPPETSLIPFKDYYASHVRALHPADMQNLYAKFPSQTAPPSKPLGQSPAAAEAPAEAAEAVPFTMKPFKDYYASHIRTLEPTDMQNLYSKFPSQRAPASKPAEPAAAAAIPFTMKPSVGTWLMAPPKMKSESPNLAAVAPVEIIEEAPKEASAPVIAKPPETSLTPFKDYYVSHVRALHPTDMQNLYAKFPSQPTPPGPSVLRAAEGPTTETTPCVSAEDARQPGPHEYTCPK